MKVEHKNTLIIIENEEERRFLNIALLIAIEIGETAVRTENLGAILVRACLDSPREAGKMRDFAEQLSDLL